MPIISILGSKEKELIIEYEATKQEISFWEWVRRKAEHPETLSWLFDDGYITCYDDLDAQQRRDLEAFIERLKDEQEN